MINCILINKLACFNILRGFKLHSIFVGVIIIQHSMNMYRDVPLMSFLRKYDTPLVVSFLETKTSPMG